MVVRQLRCIIKLYKSWDYVYLDYGSSLILSRVVHVSRQMVADFFWKMIMAHGHSSHSWGSWSCTSTMPCGPFRSQPGVPDAPRLWCWPPLHWEDWSGVDGAAWREGDAGKRERGPWSQGIFSTQRQPVQKPRGAWNWRCHLWPVCCAGKVFCPRDLMDKGPLPLLCSELEEDAAKHAFKQHGPSTWLWLCCAQNLCWESSLARAASLAFIVQLSAALKHWGSWAFCPAFFVGMALVDRTQVHIPRARRQNPMRNKARWWARGRRMFFFRLCCEQVWRWIVCFSPCVQACGGSSNQGPIWWINALGGGAMSMRQARKWQ